MAASPIDKQRLSRRLTLAFLLPIALLVLLGLLLSQQLAWLNDNALWLGRSDEIIGKIYDVQRQVSDQESAVRGYIIAPDRSLLGLYERANPARFLREIGDLLHGQGIQSQRVAEAIAKYESWRREAETVIRSDNPAPFRSIESVRLRKSLRDELQATINLILDDELRLRAQRATKASDDKKTMQLLMAVALVALALSLAFFTRRQLATVADEFGHALEKERNARQHIEDQEWVRAGLVKLSTALQGDLAAAEIAQRSLDTLTAAAGAEVGAFFSVEDGQWRQQASHGLDRDAALVTTFALGEGIVGKAALSRDVLHMHHVPGTYLKVRSGTGEIATADIVIIPCWTELSPYAVVELGFIHSPAERVRDLLGRVGEIIATGVRSAEYKARLRQLLEESQRQAEELQTQQEELRVANEELLEQSTSLREAQAQLEERKEALEQSNATLLRQHTELQAAEQKLIEKARELERNSQYKSEFLANMSHELRTPLNSTLILSRLLSENKTKNLTDEQIRFAETIYSAGNDLLTLINDVLDLSKIEAGMMEVNRSRVPIDRVVQPIFDSFAPLVSSKGLAFDLRIDEDVPPVIDIDVQRAQQVLKNLLSNALKFTKTGHIKVRVGFDASGWRFAVSDTGIGIPSNQQELIFEAFRQADGNTNRQYGGTGLGLSISRDLARLMGGNISVSSEPGKGSTFTFTVPTEPQPAPATEPPILAEPPPRVLPRVQRPPIVDDRERIDRHKKLLLFIEDDLHFARILADTAREQGFQVIAADTAAEGIRLAQQHRPDGVLLDMNLPDHSGLVVIDRLKQAPETRHIPVHVVSVAEHNVQALSMGAIGYLQKPVQREDLIGALARIEDRITRRIRRILLIEDDPIQRDSLARLLGGDRHEIVTVSRVSEALEKVAQTTFDCMVTDLQLEDGTGFELLERLAEQQQETRPPVIIYTARDLTNEEEQKLRRYSSSIILKGARSPERLLDEVTLFLHQVESELPPERQRMLHQARDRRSFFENRTILVAEDDIRNVFALSNVLEPKGARLTIARNGREALQKLEKETHVDLVLMDVMMPEMDGLQAMREIRKHKKWNKLPIIALTAKAMKSDQERCLNAGANDYIAKPLDIDTLLSLIRVWLPKNTG